jgi:hypothetical protein
VLQSWQYNPEGVPLPIHGESDGTLNTSDIDVWMWLKELSPKSRPTNTMLWALSISPFREPGRWSGLVDPRECLTPQAETLRASVMSPFPIAGRDMSTIPPSEIAHWLATYSGLTPDRVPRIEAYVARFLTKKVYNPAAIEGQQWMKKAVTRAAKCACTKASTTMITVDQLDLELAAARPLSPPPVPAASVAWHQDNGLAVPDHFVVIKPTLSPFLSPSFLTIEKKLIILRTSINRTMRRRIYARVKNSRARGRKSQAI